MHLYKSFLVAFTLLTGTLVNLPAHASFEMMGLLSYNLGRYTPEPSTYKSTSNGIGYGFMGRLDWGPGLIETGFLYTPTSLTTAESFGDVKTTGAYWIFPVMYRLVFLPPFFSIAIGPDYALVSNTKVTVGGSPVNSLTTGYKSHFGAQVSLQAVQDLGENLGGVLDLRYRVGLGNALYSASEDMKYNFFSIAIGLQKTLN